MEDMRALRKNLTSELKNSFSTKQHPYASLTEDKPNAFEVREDFDPVVKIGNPHNKGRVEQPDLDLAEYYYQFQNPDSDKHLDDNSSTVTSQSSRVINVKTSCGAEKQLIFDSRTPPPIPDLPPVPFEQREEVTLHFYPPVDKENDEEFDNVRQICKNYSTPPPIPKRVDSIAKNIDKYFDLKLVKRADEDEENAGERIEKQILNPSDVESDVSLEEEASERQLVPFTEDERSIPDVGEFQEPEILDAFPAPPVNLPILPTEQGKTAPPKPQRKKKSNPLDKESLGGLKFRELMALVGSKSEKNSALIAELIVKNGR
ncbi:Oidioi.mRNA.OKI2018_I69.chr2.g6138.t1.cds [Oikopleura dioica]|uniref:Oidioi.mRNA.OKI2018_I69.chr2.g6138.t1.cds n=1 Tax=Oikopleura dioica TaxID=34765 RepID=A0ABN7T4B1_OIKDI|nr:Oidioi.mRNA.OKI2018_I69.chr2.g6138.t1.cds [Oikopleura dioica]